VRAVVVRRVGPAEEAEAEEARGGGARPERRGRRHALGGVGQEARRRAPAAELARRRRCRSPELGSPAMRVGGGECARSFVPLINPPDPFVSLIELVLVFVAIVLKEIKNKEQGIGG
jgi:hypothetical protein